VGKVALSCPFKTTINRVQPLNTLNTRCSKLHNMAIWVSIPANLGSLSSNMAPPYRKIHTVFHMDLCGNQTFPPGTLRKLSKFHLDLCGVVWSNFCCFITTFFFYILKLSVHKLAAIGVITNVYILLKIYY
jgi:hypothetical protein